MPTEINGYSPSEETALSSLVINEVDSNETFEKMKEKGILQDNQLYLVTDELSGGGVDIPASDTEPATGNYWLDTSTEGGTYYTAGEVDTLLQNKVDVVTEAKTYYVSATGNDNNTGLTTSDPLRTIAKALSLIPRNVDKYGAAIWLLSDIEEDVDFTGFSGTSIVLRGNSNTDRATITGNITYYGNTIAYQVFVNVIGRVISSYHAMVYLCLCNITSSNNEALKASYGGKCIANDCNITALGTGHYVGVIHADYGATMHVSDCTISPVTSGTGVAFTANYAAVVYSGNNTINTNSQYAKYGGFVNIV